MKNVICVKFAAAESLVKYFGIITWVRFWNEIIEKIRVYSQLSILKENASLGKAYLLANNDKVSDVDSDEKMTLFISSICQEVLGVITFRLARLELTCCILDDCKNIQCFFCERQIKTKIKHYSIPSGELKNIITKCLISPYVQRIVNSSNFDRVGYEGLSRAFIGGRVFSANDLFDLASEQDVTYELELVCFIKMLSLIESMKGSEFLSINLSPSLLLDKTIMSLLDGVKEKERLKVELTENQFIENWEPIRSAINKYEKDGIDVWLDDVGSGYLDFNVVDLLRPKVTKIYIGLVHQACVNISLRQELKNTIDSIHCFGGKVLVEGIKTEKQAILMKSIGADYMQGYYFGKPIPWFSA